ncbi:unknown [Prevotella sp. CAG:1185]|nr:unknown [Prevotella sp. CAG:1185]
MSNPDVCILQQVYSEVSVPAVIIRISGKLLEAF